MKQHLQAGQRYEAVIRLGFFEKLVGNGVIQGKLEGAGFQDVTVTGDGGTRHAEGLWPGPSMEVELPPQVTSVQELTS